MASGSSWPRLRPPAHDDIPGNIAINLGFFLDDSPVILFDKGYENGIKFVGTCESSGLC